MHQTTIRFGDDLWRALARAAQAEGVSTAQYVREAAVARIAREGDGAPGPPAFGAGSDVGIDPTAADSDRRRTATELRDPERGAAARTASRAQAEGSTAVWAQGRQARARARAVRAESARVRALRPVSVGVPARVAVDRRRRASAAHAAATGPGRTDPASDARAAATPAGGHGAGTRA